MHPLINPVRLERVLFCDVYFPIGDAKLHLLFVSGTAGESTTNRAYDKWGEDESVQSST